MENIVKEYRKTGKDFYQEMDKNWTYTDLKNKLEMDLYRKISYIEARNVLRYVQALKREGLPFSKRSKYTAQMKANTIKISSNIIRAKKAGMCWKIDLREVEGRKEPFLIRIDDDDEDNFDV